MGIEVLVGSAMALLYPAAKRIAGKIEDQFLADASEDAYEKASQFLSWLKERWAGNRKGERAIEDLEADPDDRTYQEALRARLTEAAVSDPAFRDDLQRQIAASAPAVNVFISLDEMERVTGLIVGGGPTTAAWREDALIRVSEPQRSRRLDRGGRRRRSPRRAGS